MKPVIVLENLRSAYNVGNIIRTADALGYDVVLSGYTPRVDDGKVHKTSLGAEDFVGLREFWNTSEALETLKNEGYILIAAEKTDDCISLTDFKISHENNYAIIVGNETDGVLPETLSMVDYILHIDMLGHKESLNVGQAAAIMMWEVSR